MGKIIGIDLGTTFSAAAIIRDGDISPSILPNTMGKNITPSVVWFQALGDGLPDEPVVGEQAVRYAAVEPNNVIKYVKRQMGQASWRCVSPNGESYSAEEISAIILKKLKADAEEALGEPVTGAVITVPAYFDDAQRTATKQAGEIAGLEVYRLLNEPTAAALAYGLDTVNKGTIMVYDLGGGTFDVTIMRISDGEFDVIATGGERNLGGFDFNNCIYKYVIEHLKGEGIENPEYDDQLVAVIQEQAETAKIALSQVNQTNMFITYNNKNFKIPLDRSKFEELTVGLLNRTRDTAESVLEEAKLCWTEIDHLLMVGGSTRMPMIKQMLERYYGKKLVYEVNPDEAVALGAAVQACVCSANLPVAEGNTPEIELYNNKMPIISDVTSQALGTITFDVNLNRRVNDIIIPKNSKIPSKFSKDFYTLDDFQTSVKIEVTQGDDPDVNYVTIIGGKELPIPPYPKNAPIRISYNYDIDQTVFVEVFDLTANKSLGTFEIDRSNNMDANQLKNAVAKMDSINVN